MEPQLALLTRIQQITPPEALSRTSALRAKRESESISDSEYEELTKLTDLSEELQAERVTAMVELAKLRGISLLVLMEQLDIHFPEPAATTLLSSTNHET